MDKNYYKEYYHLERNHWWFKVRNQIIIERLKKMVGENPNLNILNVGVATGHTSELLSDFGKVTSVEYEKDCCKFLREELKMDVINGSILELPFDDDTFDIVCAFDVIEHIDDDALGVSEMKRVCKNEGILYISVPAFQFLWSKHDVVNHHYRRYTLPQVKRLFNPQHGELIYNSYFNSILFFPIALFRVISTLFANKNEQSEEADSDFKVMGGNGIIGSMLELIFKFEKFLLRFLKFPLGVSILFAQRNKS